MILASSEKYTDIMQLPAHHSAHHPPMARSRRAAQFMPFAALTGYEDLLKYTAAKHNMITRIELDEDAKTQLNRVLVSIINQRAQGKTPQVEITVFEEQTENHLGSYVTYTGNVQAADMDQRSITLICLSRNSKLCAKPYPMRITIENIYNLRTQEDNNMQENSAG